MGGIELTCGAAGYEVDGKLAKLVLGLIDGMVLLLTTVIAQPSVHLRMRSAVQAFLFM